MNIKEKIKIPNFFVIINNKISSSSRVLLSGMLLSLLWFMIYYNANEYFFHPLYFILPSILIVLTLIVLPALGKKDSSNNVTMEGIDTSNMQIEEVSLSTGNDMGQNYNNTSNGIAIDESMLSNMIDEKINSIAMEWNESKQKVNDAITTVNNVKADIDELKKNIKDLTEAFETTLVDFKAFQAEIANPLNFMRKYFDQLDIKNISDPSLPLQQSKMVDDTVKDKDGNGDNNNGVSNYGSKVGEMDNGKDDGNGNGNSNGDGNGNGRHMTEKKDTIGNIISIAKANNITLSTLMELILTIGEFMKTFGNEYTKILGVQCKILNISRDGEMIVYGIVDMLSKSTMTPEECVISLYRLASILGFTDKDADALYARVKMNTHIGIGHSNDLADTR
jgi:hypothetical protein